MNENYDKNDKISIKKIIIIIIISILLLSCIGTGIFLFAGRGRTIQPKDTTEHISDKEPVILNDEEDQKKKCEAKGSSYFWNEEKYSCEKVITPEQECKNKGSEYRWDSKSKSCKTLEDLKTECVNKGEKYYWDDVSKTCQTVKKTPHKHTYKETVIAPTCSSKGYTLHTCECGNSYKSDYTKTIDHHYETTIVPATCKTRGYTLHKCTECGKEYKDNYTNYAEHDFVDSVIAPTCTEKGYTLHKCKVCGYEKKDHYTNATGHKYVDTVIEPTTTEQGYTLHKCSVCGDEYIDSYSEPLGEVYEYAVYAVNTADSTPTIKFVDVKSDGSLEVFTDFDNLSDIKVDGKEEEIDAFGVIDVSQHEYTDTAILTFKYNGKKYRAVDFTWSTEAGQNIKLDIEEYEDDYIILETSSFLMGMGYDFENESDEYWPVISQELIDEGYDVNVTIQLTDEEKKTITDLQNQASTNYNIKKGLKLLDAAYVDIFTNRKEDAIITWTKKEDGITYLLTPTMKDLPEDIYWDLNKYEIDVSDYNSLCYCYNPYNYLVIKFQKKPTIKYKLHQVISNVLTVKSIKNEAEVFPFDFIINRMKSAKKSIIEEEQYCMANPTSIECVYGYGFAFPWENKFSYIQNFYNTFNSNSDVEEVDYTTSQLIKNYMFINNKIYESSFSAISSIGGLNRPLNWDGNYADGESAYNAVGSDRWNELYKEKSSKAYNVDIKDDYNYYGNVWTTEFFAKDGKRIVEIIPYINDDYKVDAKNTLLDALNCYFAAGQITDTEYNRAIEGIKSVAYEDLAKDNDRHIVIQNYVYVDWITDKIVGYVYPNNLNILHKIDGSTITLTEENKVKVSND